MTHAQREIVYQIVRQLQANGLQIASNGTQWTAFHVGRAGALMSRGWYAMISNGRAFVFAPNDRINYLYAADEHGRWFDTNGNWLSAEDSGHLMLIAYAALGRGMMHICEDHIEIAYRAYVENGGRL